MAAPTKRYMLAASRGLTPTSVLPGGGALCVGATLLMLGYHEITFAETAHTTTDDGVTWTEVLALAAGREFIGPPLWTGTHFVCIAKDATTTYAYRSTTAAPGSWTVATVAVTTAVSSKASSNTGIIVLTGQSGTAGWRSGDHGATWTTVTLPNGYTRYGDGAWDGATFVFPGELSGTGSYAARSADGITWAQTFITADRIVIVFGGGGVFIGYRPLGGSIIYGSAGGTFWTEGPFSASPFVRFALADRVVATSNFGDDFVFSQLDASGNRLGRSSRNAYVPLAGTIEFMTPSADGTKTYVFENSATAPRTKLHVMAWEDIPNVVLTASASTTLTGEAFFQVDVLNAVAVRGAAVGAPGGALYFGMPARGDSDFAEGYTDTQSAPSIITQGFAGGLVYGYATFYANVPSMQVSLGNRAGLRKTTLVNTTAAVAGRIARAALDVCRNVDGGIGGINDGPPPPTGSGAGGTNAYSPAPGEFVLLFNGGQYTPHIAPVPAGYSCTYDPTRAVVTSTGTYIGPVVCTP